MEQDPEGMVDSTNLYAYVVSNPLRYTDPSGRIVEKKDAKDQATKFKAQKKAAKEFIQSSWMPQTTASIRSFSCHLDNIKCSPIWESVAYDKNLGTPAQNEGQWLAVIINGEEITLDQLGNYFVGYNGRYSGKTLNDPNGTIFNDIYAGGIYAEEHDLELEEDVDGTSESSKSKKDAEEDEKRSRPWYDRGYNDADGEICEAKKIIP